MAAHCARTAGVRSSRSSLKRGHPHPNGGTRRGFGRYHFNVKRSLHSADPGRGHGSPALSNDAVAALTLPADAAPQALAVVAVTGSDGSGKSTLVAELVARLRNEHRVASVYLGQSSGRIAAWIATIPLLGPRAHRFLTQKADRVHARPDAAPGNATALVIYLLSRWRAYKFRRMLSLCRRGFLVVADRYPQSTMPGFLFDGPQLAKTSGGNWWIRTLRARERALYDRMAEPRPMLLIRLNIDADTAHARKPDHSLATLRKKADSWPHLEFNAMQILEQDAREDAATVLDASLRAVRRSLSGARA